MLETEPVEPAEGSTAPSSADLTPDTPPAAPARRRRTTRATKAAAPEPGAATDAAATGAPATDAPAADVAATAEVEAPPKKTTRSRRKTTAVAAAAPEPGAATDAAAADAPAADVAATAEVEAPPKKTTRSRRKTTAVAAAAEAPERTPPAHTPPEQGAPPVAPAAAEPDPAAGSTAPPAVPAVVFVPPPLPETAEKPPSRSRRRKTVAAEATAGGEEPSGAPADVAEAATAPAGDGDALDDNDADGDADRRRRRRGRRGRGRGRDGADAGEAGDEDGAQAVSGDGEDGAAAQEGGDASGEADADATSTSTRRRRRRKRRSGSGGGDDATTDDPPNTVVHVREARPAGDEVQSVRGSTRLEAKRQRRREGRETQRRRPPILSEAEFLARREAVDRTMVVRQRGDRTQIAVLEDGVLVEHYVTRSGSTSYAGNVYLGRVQNVLPSMEAAFVDIGKGRNAVLYAGEVNWDVAGLEGKARSIEQALRSGDSVMVQVTKDPMGHKGARLTSQISLPGRYLVYVPGGSMTGISRKLPDTERQRLKDILKRIVPDRAGVIIRTAAEGASEEELARDVSRLQAQWQVIQDRAARGGAPVLLSEEPDLVIRVVRDIFNEDFAHLIVDGEEAWNTLHDYLDHVAPDLAPRLSRHTADTDVFADLRIDEQLMKGLDRKVWLPSGGSLVIDRTEAMTVIDVNTGKFTGKGGNLEETVTRNNLEAAEEIVRQLRLRDVGGIIVIDFIDMVLESNRDLVLRRLLECLGRDRTKHQVAEVTSLGLVQMTRKRVGQGLLEAFSEPCEACKGRGVHIHTEPVEPAAASRGNGGRNAAAADAEAAPATGDRPARRGRGRGSRAASAEPAATAQPVVEQPAVEQPAVEQPAVEQPAVEQPAAESEQPVAGGRASAGEVAGADSDDGAPEVGEAAGAEAAAPSRTGEPAVSRRQRRRRVVTRPPGAPAPAAEPPVHAAG